MFVLNHNIHLHRNNLKKINSHYLENMAKIESVADWYKSVGGPLQEKINKNGKAYVYTNEDMAIDLINNFTNIQDGDVVCEPSKGGGAFYNNFPDNCKKIYCEIDEGIDYLQDERKCDITCGNPPFVPRKLFWNFHLKAMENTRREIYWLINMGSLNVFTPKRLNEMKERGWYINKFHIVSDKRWYGRYVWIKISKTNNNFFTWKKGSY